MTRMTQQAAPAVTWASSSSPTTRGSLEKLTDHMAEERTIHPSYRPEGVRP